MTDDRHADERTVPTWPVADDAPATVPAGPVDDGSAAVFDGQRLQVVVGRRVLLDLPATGLPDDWWRQVQRTGSLELVVPPGRPADLAAATEAHTWITDRRPSLHLALSPELAGTVRTPREEYDLATREVHGLAGHTLAPPELPSSPGRVWTLGELRREGLLPERCLDATVSVDVDATDVAHGEYQCARVTGSTRTANVPMVRAVSTACATCGYHQDRPVGSLPHYRASSEVKAVVEILSRLSRLPPTQAPRWSELLDATVAGDGLRIDYTHYSTYCAHLSAGVLAQLRAGAHTGAGRLRSDRDVAGVEMAVVLAADTETAGRIHQALATVPPALADATTSMLRSGDDPRRYVDDLVRVTGVDHDTVRAAVTRPADWLDRQRAVLCGPPRVARIDLWYGWPKHPLARLVMLRYGAVVADRNTAFVTVPEPVLAVLAQAAGSDVCTDVAAMAVGDTAAIYYDAMTLERRSTYGWANKLNEARAFAGVLSDDEPVGWRPFYQEED